MIQAIYDPATGVILRKCSAAQSQARSGEAMLEIARGVTFDDESGYVDIGASPHVLTARPPSPPVSMSADTVIADGVAEIVLSGAPAGAVVSIGTASIVADGDDIAITTDLTGINRVTVDAFPARLWRGSFNGTAA